MAIQIDYFLARSEADAAATAELEAGPRSDFSDVVPSQEIDPGLALGYLAGLLTGIPLEEFLENQGPSFVAASESDAQLVLEIDPIFVREIASLEGPFETLALQWSEVTAPPEAEPWQPHPRDLSEFLDGFTALARRSVAGEGGLYCWLWP